MKIYTIGHSVHSKERFIEMLAYADIEVLADVRRFPASRKHPQFSKERMQEWLPESRIEYRHFTSLSGRRNKSDRIQDVLNDGWNNQSFHNYADYTLTDTFQKGIKQLEQLAEKKSVAYCCSERHPSRCHRLLKIGRASCRERLEGAGGAGGVSRRYERRLGAGDRNR